MKTAVIIGISGQDGAYLSQLLLEKNYHVIGITRHAATADLQRLSYLNIKNSIQIVQLDAQDNQSICSFLASQQIDEIYNLGAQSSVGQSFEFPIETVQYNIMSVINWLEAIKKTNRNIKFYQASSSEMFGNVSKNKLPLKESNVFHPASPYGVSKAAAHWLTVNYRESHDLFAACGILFNHESCLRGPNYVVKKIINSAIQIEMGLTNGPIKVGNISIKRDWGYAPYYVEAMWRMLQQDTADDYLICSGQVCSLKALIDYVLLALGLDYDQTIVVDPQLYRPVDLEEIYGDNSKAKTALGWKYDLSTHQLIHKLIADEYKFIEWEQAKK